MKELCPHCGNQLRPRCKRCGGWIGLYKNTTGLCRRCVCIVRNKTPEMSKKMAANKRWRREYAATIAA